MTVYRNNGRSGKELTLRQRRLVSSEIAREFKSWRRKKGEPSAADRQQIIAIGFAKARRKMPSIPAANPADPDPSLLGYQIVKMESSPEEAKLTAEAFRKLGVGTVTSREEYVLAPHWDMGEVRRVAARSGRHLAQPGWIPKKNPLVELGPVASLGPAAAMSMVNPVNENPSALAAAIGGMTGAIVMNALSNPLSRSNPSAGVMGGDNLNELQEAAHSMLKGIYWVITGPGHDGTYWLRVDVNDFIRARKLLTPAFSANPLTKAETEQVRRYGHLAGQSAKHVEDREGRTFLSEFDRGQQAASIYMAEKYGAIEDNPSAGASVGQESPDHPGFKFYGNLYSDSSRTRTTLDALRDAGIKYIAEGGGNLLDVYIHKDDWGRALMAVEGIGRSYKLENPLTDQEKRVLRKKAENWDRESAVFAEGPTKHYARGRAAEARDVAAWGGIQGNPIITIPAGHPTRHDVPHNSEFCSKCVHEAYCTECRWALTHPTPKATRRRARRNPAPRRNSHLEGEPCDVCGGPLNFMGTLGNLEWYRCRNCGMEIQSQAPRENPLTGGEVREIESDAKSYIMQSYGGGYDMMDKASTIGRAEGMQQVARKYGPRNNPMLMTVMGANPKRSRPAPKRNPSGPRRKTTMSLEKFAQFVKSKNDPKLWAAFVKKVKGYQKWTHGSMPKNVTIETMNVPGVSGLWMTYGMGREPEKVYVMPKGSKRKGAWKHPWGKMPYLKGDPEAGIILTKLVRGNRITDFLHG